MSKHHTCEVVFTNNMIQTRPEDKGNRFVEYRLACGGTTRRTVRRDAGGFLTGCYVGDRLRCNCAKKVFDPRGGFRGPTKKLVHPK